MTAARRELLLTYAARPEHATRGYTQGMSDLLAPLIAVLHPHLPRAAAAAPSPPSSAPENAPVAPPPSSPENAAVPPPAPDDANAGVEGAVRTADEGSKEQNTLPPHVSEVLEDRVSVADLYFCFEYLMDHSVCVASPHDDDIDSHLVCCPACMTLNLKKPERW